MLGPELIAKCFLEEMHTQTNAHNPPEGKTIARRVQGTMRKTKENHGSISNDCENLRTHNLKSLELI